MKNENYRIYTIKEHEKKIEFLFKIFRRENKIKN